MDPMDIIKENKPRLIRWLRGDSFILQHVQSKSIITMDEYVTVNSIQDPFEKTTKLLDQILEKGPGVCNDFLDLLKQDEVNESRPELRQWISTVNTSSGSFDRSSFSKIIPQAPAVHAQTPGVSVNIQADGSSSVFAPSVVGCNTNSLNINLNMGTSVRSEEKERKS